MRELRDRVITIALREIGQSSGHKYECTREDGRWCSTFVIWVLRQAGFAVDVDLQSASPGKQLCTLLGKPILEPRMGDIVCFDKIQHYAIVVGSQGAEFAIKGRSIPDGFSHGMLTTVDGASWNEQVSVRTRPRRSAGASFYSIDELIRRYEWTGASTGEVA